MKRKTKRNLSLVMLMLGIFAFVVSLKTSSTIEKIFFSVVAVLPTLSIIIIYIIKIYTEPRGGGVVVGNGWIRFDRKVQSIFGVYLDEIEYFDYYEDIMRIGIFLFLLAIAVILFASGNILWGLVPLIAGFCVIFANGLRNDDAYIYISVLTVCVVIVFLVLQVIPI